jgi:hypothetical protein
MKIKKRALLANCAVFAACWIMLFSWIFHRVSIREKQNYPGTPNGVRNMVYPSFLLSQSRITHLDVRKLLFLGDSSVRGTTSFNPANNIGNILGETLLPLKIQTFSFALDGIGPADHRNILRENAESQDFVIIELHPYPYVLKTPVQIDEGHRKLPYLLHLPFILTREEIALTLKKSPALIPFQFVEFTKKAIKQRSLTINEKDDEAYISFNRGKLSNDKKYFDEVLARANTPLDSSTIATVKSLLEMRRSSASRTLVYITPVNPFFLSQPQLGQQSEFRKNMKTLNDLAKDSGLPCMDYTSRENLLDVSDFHDGIHLTDEGALKFSKILKEDVVNLFKL